MIFLRHLVIGLLLIATSLVRAQTADSMAVTNLNYTQLINYTASYSVPVLVQLKADWCLICKREIPVHAALQEQFKNKLVILNVDLDDNPEIGKDLEIDALPVHILFYKGEAIWNKVGFTESAPVAEIINELLQKK